MNKSEGEGRQAEILKTSLFPLSDLFSRFKARLLLPYAPAPQDLGEVQHLLEISFVNVPNLGKLTLDGFRMLCKCNYEIFKAIQRCKFTFITQFRELTIK